MSNTWFGYPTGDCYIDSGSPTTSYCVTDANYVGPNDHTLLNFPVAASLPTHVQITQSYAVMTLSSETATTPEEIGVWQAAKPWTSQATWDSYDGSDPWGTPGGDTTGAMEDQNEVGASGDLGATFYWDINASMQSWSDGNPPQVDGLIFAPADGSSASNTLGFATETDPNGNNPYIEVYYEPRLGDYPGAYYDTHPLSDGSSVGVNPANGNLLLSNTDLNLPGVGGLDAKIGRYYNDLAPDQDSFGVGWSMGTGADTYLAIGSDENNLIDYYDGTGNVQLFHTDPSGNWVIPPGDNVQITMSSPGNMWGTTQIKLYFPATGITETFDMPADVLPKIGVLASVADPGGDTITYTYTSSGQLASLTDTHGNTTSFSYNTAGYISAITAPDGTSSHYTQNSAGELTSYVNPQGQTTSYGYDSYGNLTQITTPDGQVLNVAYDAGNTNRVQSVQQLADAGAQSGPTSTYTYEDGSACSSQNGYGPGWLEGAVTDPAGDTTGYCTNDLSALAATLGSYTTTYSYDADGRLTGAEG